MSYVRDTAHVLVEFSSFPGRLLLSVDHPNLARAEELAGEGGLQAGVVGGTGRVVVPGERDGHLREPGLPPRPTRQARHPHQRHTALNIISILRNLSSTFYDLRS